MTNTILTAKTEARRAASRLAEQLAPFEALTDAELVRTWRRSNDHAELQSAYTVIQNRVNAAGLVPDFTDDCDVQQTIVDTLANADREGLTTMTITAPAVTIPARSTQIVTSAKCLEVGDIVLAKSETTPGNLVLSIPGGTVVGIAQDHGFVAVTLADSNGDTQSAAMYAHLVLDVVRPWPAA